MIVLRAALVCVACLLVSQCAGTDSRVAQHARIHPETHHHHSPSPSLTHIIHSLTHTVHTHHQLHASEVVARNHELSGDRLIAEADLARRTGTLRYLGQLKRARERARARAAASAAAAAAAAEAGSGDGGGAAGAAGAAAATTAATPTNDDEDGACSCPVCMVEIGAACAVLPCGHQLCCGCMEALAARVAPGTPWPQRRVGCPTCRARHHVGDVAYVDGGDGTGGTGGGGAGGTMAPNVVSTTSETVIDAVAAAGGAGASAGARAAAARPLTPPQGGWWAGEAGVRVEGSYGAKVEAVARRVKHVLEADARARVLVFTQWADLLDVVAHALRRNGVAHAAARGRQGFARAVDEFKAGAAAADAAAAAAEAEAGAAAAAVAGGSGAAAAAKPEDQAAAADDAGGGATAAAGPAARLAAAQHLPDAAAARAAPRVLLLLTSQGGLGLNLTEAQHVVLVEPLLDPALEVQAVGRVHRLGQARACHVHRFVVRCHSLLLLRRGPVIQMST